MSLPTSLPSLSDREAVMDAMYRAVLGIDNDDTELFDSAFTAEATFAMGDQVSHGLDEIHTNMFDTVSKLDTTHFISSIRVVITGESEASLMSSSLAQHYRAGQGMQPGATRLLSGALYNVKLVHDKDSGLWKITEWKMRLVWTEGDWAVFTDK